MGQRLRTAVIFLAILVPSIHFAWTNRDMPQFAYLHDDGILFVSAKSLAHDGYRISSLPKIRRRPSFRRFTLCIYPASGESILISREICG